MGKKAEESAIPNYCTKSNCSELAAEDSVQCVKHRDETRKYNQRHAAKAKGLPLPAEPLVKPRVPSALSEHPTRSTPETVCAVLNGTGESWDDWKTRLLAELGDAETKLKVKLESVQAARGAIAAL